MEKVCSITGQSFVISDSDLAIYQQLGIPVPTLCPDERVRKRLAWRNERILYRRKCDATNSEIVSIFHQDHAFPVYSQEHWWSDSWDALFFGRDFDFDRGFFEQFAELFQVVPQCALRCPQSENCEYTNQCEANKDCYLVFCSNGSEGCLHGMWYQSCKDCVDCTYLEKGELCYQILNGKNCYSCTYSENLQNCTDCHFCKDCIGCSNCVGCVNLRNKEYYFYNEKLTPEEYALRLSELMLHTRTGVKQFSDVFAPWSHKFPAKYYAGKNNEGFSGDYLENNKNVFDSYNCRNAENLRHGRDAWSARNSLDLTETLEQDFCIELEGCYMNSNSGFSAKISETHDSWYSSHCFNSSDLFGCVGLKKNQYCILNKQYSKDEYFSLKEEIISHMKDTGEWGEYFPIEYSPFAYNESVAFEYFPLSRKDIEEHQLDWKESVDTALGSEPAVIPDSIEDSSEAILEQILVCTKSGRPFKLQQAEFEIYKKIEVPVPDIHPDLRHELRLARRNPRKLLTAACAACKKEFLSTFESCDSPAILCEECFVASVD